MNQEPLFSVLIANYNNAQYLKEAISSIASQTYKNWEIIFVDDCSEDNSIELIKSIKNLNVNIYKNPENKGCGFTKSAAAGYANGEILGYLDPDDALTNDALAAMVEQHLKFPSASLVSSSHYICSPELAIEREAYAAEKIPEGESYLSYGKGITHFVSFKKTYYDRTIGINENLKRSVDQDLYYKLEEVGETVFLNRPLYYYRIHERGISTFNNLSKSRYWFVKVKQEAFERRRNIPGIKNITKSEIESWKSIYYVTRASDEFRHYNLTMGICFSIKGFRIALFDRYFALKIKTLFLNTTLHRVYKEIFKSKK